MSSLPLAKNAKVALVCTGTPGGSKCEPKQIAEYFMSHYRYSLVYKQDTYLPLPATRRAEIFYSYLLDDSIDIIWSMRGGEGTADILPYLDAMAHNIRSVKPKLLIGYSDFTAALIYFQQRFQWPVIHAAGARDFPQRLVSQACEWETLSWLKQASLAKLTKIEPLNAASHSTRSISAHVTGGNLTLLHLSLQEIWQLNPRGKILLIEEVNEKPYQVDRTLKHLVRVGFFNDVKAVLFAGFDIRDLCAKNQKLVSLSMRRVLIEFARQVNFPVLFTTHIGHNQHNRPVPFHQEALLQLGKKAYLTFAKLGL